MAKMNTNFLTGLSTSLEQKEYQRALFHLDLDDLDYF